jgi:hypothetical protein
MGGGWFGAIYMANYTPGGTVPVITPPAVIGSGFSAWLILWLRRRMVEDAE